MIKRNKTLTLNWSKSRHVPTYFLFTNLKATHIGKNLIEMSHKKYKADLHGHVNNNNRRKYLST